MLIKWASGRSPARARGTLQGGCGRDDRASKTTSTSPLRRARKQTVESRPVVAHTGGEVVVEVDRLDTLGPQGGSLRRAKENGSENRSDKPAAVGPVFPSATRGGPAAPLHPERRRPAAHGQHRSQRVTKWLAEPETAGSTAGRDRVASYLPFGRAGTLPAGVIVVSTDGSASSPDRCRRRGPQPSSTALEPLVVVRLAPDTLQHQGAAVRCRGTPRAARCVKQHRPRQPAPHFRQFVLRTICEMIARSCTVCPSTTRGTPWRSCVRKRT